MNVHFLIKGMFETGFAKNIQKTRIGVHFPVLLQRVYMNMDLPLNNYYINSAKNPFEFELKHLDIPDAI